MEPKCSGDENQLTFLEKNFSELYLNDYSRFWDIVHKAAKKAQTCDSSIETATTLAIIKVTSGYKFQTAAYRTDFS